jgi:hypothetical protein
MFLVKSYSIDNIEINASTLKEIKFTGTKISGYKKVAMHESYENASTNGTLSSKCFTYNRAIGTADTCSLICTNMHASNPAKIKAVVTILYAKEEFVG